MARSYIDASESPAIEQFIRVVIERYSMVEDIRSSEIYGFLTAVKPGRVFLPRITLTH